MNLGTHEYQGLIGTTPETSLAELRARSPQLYGTLLDAFGGPLAHAQLGRAERELATVAMLAAPRRHASQLAVHARAALHEGVAPSELVALAEHVSVYAGFP